MKLSLPPFPESLETAPYFYIQAAHRHTAVDSAIEAVRSGYANSVSDSSEPSSIEAATAFGDWVVESLLLGSLIREYHEWEKATKIYFNAQRSLNKTDRSIWRGKLPSVSNASHVDYVRVQLSEFGVDVSGE